MPIEPTTNKPGVPKIRGDEKSILPGKKKPTQEKEEKKPGEHRVDIKV